MANTNCLEGMKCPQCGNEDKLLIQALVWVAMTDEGSDPFDDATENDGDQEYDGSHACKCPECGFCRRVEDFYEGQNLALCKSVGPAVTRCVALYWHNVPPHAKIQALFPDANAEYVSRRVEQCQAGLVEFLGSLDTAHHALFVRHAVERYLPEVLRAGY